MKSKKLVFWTIISGNILDHYDTALYSFLAPIIAPLFFPKHDPVIALILTFGLMSISMLTRPLGAVFFGSFARRFGPQKSLILTLEGISISTFMIGLLPDYNAIGIFAPILLAILRALQGFFTAGEYIVASLLIQELVEDKKQNSASGFYNSSTIVGILIASFVSTLVIASSESTYNWRFAFFASALTGLIVLILRNKAQYQTIFTKQASSIKEIIQNKYRIIKIIIVSSFTYLTYSIPFVFFNSFIPLISDITLTEMMQVNTVLLCFDMIIISLFSKIPYKYLNAKFMAYMASLLAISAIPIFLLLTKATIFKVTCVRTWIIILGVGFVTPLNNWLFNLTKGNNKYLITSVGYAIGSELFGRSTPAICLFLWHYTGKLIYAPALYISLIAIICSIALTRKS